MHTRSHLSARAAELLCWRHGGALPSAITVALKKFRYIKQCQAGSAGSVALHLCFNAFFNSESLLIWRSKKERKIEKRKNAYGKHRAMMYFLCKMCH